jgi:hypothetical protein
MILGLCSIQWYKLFLRDSDITIKIAERYMGKNKADEYGRFNSGEGAVLVRIKPTKIIAEKDIAILR